MKRASILLLFLSACGGPHRPLAPSISGAGGGVSYATVRPIFAKYCSECHPSRSGPDWLDYSQAVAFVRNGILLRRAVVEKSMPPAGSAQAASITDAERNLIGAWVKAGGIESAGGAAAAPEEAQGNPLIQSCLHCHGTNGPGGPSQPKIPRLTGQNKAYLILQLTRFKWRDRTDPSGAMNDVAFGLSDEDMTNAAEYFSSLPPFVGDGLPTNARELKVYQRGKTLALEQCISCHRNPENNGRPLDVLEPALEGQSKQYLFNQLLSFRSDAIRSPVMHEVAKDLSDRDVDALAEFFSRGLAHE